MKQELGRVRSELSQLFVMLKEKDQREPTPTVEAGAFRWYWLIEYDARFAGSWRQFVEENSSRKEDLLGTHVAAFTPQNCGWEAWRIPGEHWDIPLLERWKFYAVVMRISHRMYCALRDNSTHTHGALETYVSSLCAKHFGPKSLADFDMKYWDGDSVRYIPTHCTAKEFAAFRLQPKNANRLFHPIKNESRIPLDQINRQRQEIQAILNLPDAVAVAYHRSQAERYKSELYGAASAQNQQLGPNAGNLESFIALPDAEILAQKRLQFEKQLEQLAAFV